MPGTCPKGLSILSVPHLGIGVQYPSSLDGAKWTVVAPQSLPLLALRADLHYHYK
jgi:hypothetical protein